MDSLIDDVARILASSMPRRKVFRLIGGAIAAAVVPAIGVRPVSAQQCPPGQNTCGNGNNAICCQRSRCCAAAGNRATCCTRGECFCNNGTCAASTGGRCPGGCTFCQP